MTSTKSRNRRRLRSLFSTELLRSEEEGAENLSIRRHKVRELQDATVKRMRAAAVSRPLASVKKTCEAGHMVIFDDQVSYLYNKSSSEVNYLREESGTYMFDVWGPPNKTRDFGRP